MNEMLWDTKELLLFCYSFVITKSIISIYFFHLIFFLFLLAIKIKSNNAWKDEDDNFNVAIPLILLKTLKFLFKKGLCLILR